MRHSEDGYWHYAPHTHRLALRARQWMTYRDVLQATKQRWSQSGETKRIWLSEYAEMSASELESRKQGWSYRTKKLLKQHPLWPWLEGKRGLSGPTTAYIIGKIRDPHRFPGQKCEKGHYVRPVFEEGASCPVDDSAESGSPDDQCGAPLLKPRDGTGVRSLHHYMGLFPGANKQKGQQSTWNPELKGLCLAPETGLATQILLHKTEPYLTTFREEKERLKRERGYRSNGERVGPVESASENEIACGELPPLIKLHRIAQTIAIKRFCGDLLMEWKQVQPLGSY